MVLVKMLMDLDPLSMRGSLVMMMASISPSGREVSQQNSSTGALDCFCPGSASRWRCFVPKASLSFSPGQNPPYSRRWASEACQGPHKPPRCALVPHGHLGAPPLIFFLPVFFIYSKIILHKFSGRLELCRIGPSDLLLSGPEFQLRM